MQTVIEKNRQRDYERHESWRRFEEATDIAERVGYPIDHTVHYEMRGGLAYSKSDKESRPFRQLTDESRRKGHELFTGVNKFEAVRREHEHQEALLVDRFGRGELDGTVLVKISMVPDAVREGTAQIDGYRKDLLRSFVRIYYRADEGVACRLFSLDKSDHIGMTAVGDFLGIDTEGRGSEDVLADHALVDIDDVTEDKIDLLVEQTKSVYDRALELQTGEQFHAGSKFKDKKDALGIVQAQPSLLDEHMVEVSKIMATVLEPSLQKQSLESLRKRTAAAVDLTQQGVSVNSINDSDVADQASSGEYGGECATGSTSSSSSSSLEAAAMSRGRERKWERGNCQACLKDGIVGECSVCKDCEKKSNAGVDLMEVRKKALAKQAQAQKAEAAKQKYGENMTDYSHEIERSKKPQQRKLQRGHRVVTVIEAGGARKVTVDQYGNEVS